MIDNKRKHFIEHPVYEDIDKWLLEYEEDLKLIKYQIQVNKKIPGYHFSELITPHFYFD